MKSEKQFETHEATCERCGRCCQRKIELNGEIIAAGPCPMYDGDEKKCLVYSTRFQRVPFCRNILQAIDGGLLPEDCPYVKDFPGYKSIVDKWRNVDEDNE